MAQAAAGVVPLSGRVTTMRARFLIVTLGCAVLAGAVAPAGSIDPAQAQAAPPAAAQNPPQRGTPPPQPPGQRGGRGRGGIQVMSLTTSAWKDGGQIPKPYTQVGEEASPPLAWEGAPANTASYVLIVHDVDALSGGGATDVLHWLVWNIPGTARGLPRGVPPGSELPDGTRQISATGPNYRGPGAPASGPPHHYLFELFALDGTLDVPAVGASPAATRTAVITAMTGRVRGKATLVGRFRRR